MEVPIKLKMTFISNIQDGAESTTHHFLKRMHTFFEEAQSPSVAVHWLTFTCQYLSVRCQQ